MSKIGKRAASLVAAAALALAALSSGTAAAQEKLTVFAAASLKNALDGVAAAWMRDTGKETAISYAGSSALARQIEQGAPADLFISADLDWMNYLSEKGFVEKATEVRLLGNRIVLVAPAGSDVSVGIVPGFDLAGALDGGRLAMANTDAVPAGKYGKAALEALGVWASVEESVAQAENVRAALALVAMGEAPLGVVYRTDAAAEPRVKVVGAFPKDTHPPIVYPAAVLAESNNPDAEAFLDYLRSAPAKSLFEEQGFTVLAEPASN